MCLCGGFLSSVQGLELTQGDHPCKLVPLLPLGKSLHEVNHVSVSILLLASADCGWVDRHLLSPGLFDLTNDGYLGFFHLACRCSIRVAAPGRQRGEQRSRVVTNAIPVAIPFVVTLAVVGAAVVAISKKEKLPTLQDNSRVCHSIRIWHQKHCFRFSCCGVH